MGVIGDQGWAHRVKPALVHLDPDGVAALLFGQATTSDRGSVRPGEGVKDCVTDAGAILRVMGLRPRQKAERYLWAEADGDVAALLAAYTQPEKMREIAAIIRSWIPCPYGPHAPDPSCSRCKGTGRWDARDLWEVLRREKRRGLWEAGHAINETALYAVIGSWCREVRADGGTSGFWGPDETKVDAEREGIARRFAALS